jgi:N-formylglutamate amidohydrolase
MLRALLERKVARFGYVILLCAHSMPSVGRAGHVDAGIPRADVVPGTRGRTSAHHRIIDGVESVAVAHGRSVEHDRPYRGGWSTTHYGRPAAHHHAIQVELARRMYLDEHTLARKVDGMTSTRALCRALVARLASVRAEALT